METLLWILFAVSPGVAAFFKFFWPYREYWLPWKK